jgi:hypothetical protein
MKSIRLVIPMLLAALQARAVEDSMLNLRLPSALEPWQAQFILQHRFYGAIDEKPVLDRFFGMAEGANVGLGFRLCPVKNLEVSVRHTFLNKEYGIGTGYSFFPGIPGFRGQAGLELDTYKTFRFEHGRLTDRRRNVWFGRLDVRGPALGFLTPVVNVGYDSENRKTGFGLGLNAAVSKGFGLIGEYFPRVDRGSSEGSLSTDCFAVGLKIQTYGHHFLFQVGNSTDIGLQRMMRGAPTKNLMFGFGIQRLFE